MANLSAVPPQHLVAISLFAGLCVSVTPCFSESRVLSGNTGNAYPQPSRECDGDRERLNGSLPVVLEQLEQLLDDSESPTAMAVTRDKTERTGDDFLLMAQAAFRRALSTSSSVECNYSSQEFHLSELIQSAVATHPAVLSRQAERESARHGISSARWQYAPSVTAFNDGHNGGVGKVEVQQPLWMGGALSAGVDQATAQHNGSRWALLESQFGIAEQVIDAYGDWLANQKKQASIRHSIDQLNRLYLRIQRREAAGLANVSEVILAKARLSQANSDLAQTEAAIRAALASLTELTGKRDLQGALAEDQARGEPIELSVLQEMARGYSPALKRALAAEDVAEAEVAKRRAALSPQVSLVWQRAYGDYIVPDPKSYERLMVRLQFAPGAGASALSNIEAAEAHRRSATSDRDAIARDLSARTAAFFERYRATQDSIANAESTLSSAREVQASYERQFLAGRRGWLDVMNAVREVDDAQRGLAAQKASLLVLESKISLYRGTLLTGEGQ